MKIKLFLSLLLIVFLSCKQNDDTSKDDSSSSNFELLIAHPWHGVEVVRYVNGHEDTHTPIPNSVYVFHTDNTYQKIDDGNVVQDGTWELIENSMLLVRVRFFSQSLNHNVLDDLNVIRLTGDQFDFSLPYIDGSNDILRDDYHYKK